MPSSGAEEFRTLCDFLIMVEAVNKNAPVTDQKYSLFIHLQLFSLPIYFSIPVRLTKYYSQFFGFYPVQLTTGIYSFGLFI